MLKSTAPHPAASRGFSPRANTISDGATGRPSNAASALSARAMPAMLARAASVPDPTARRLR